MQRQHLWHSPSTPPTTRWPSRLPLSPHCAAPWRLDARWWALSVQVVLLALPALAAAATILVTSTADGAPATDGQCTLREAITNANGNDQSGSPDCGAGSGADTILFSVNGTITMGSTLPTITAAGGELTIDGLGQVTPLPPGCSLDVCGSSQLTLSGNHAVRVLFVGEGATLTVRHLAIANGYVEFVLGGDDPTAGAGIFNSGTLTVINSTLHHNTVNGGVGGAISSAGSTLTVINSTFAHNDVHGHAGAIFLSSGFATVVNSSFYRNYGLISGGVISIESFPASAHMTLTNSTVFDNTTECKVPNCEPVDDYPYGAIAGFSNITLHNTIIANNDGGNCHYRASNGLPVDDGGNLQDVDASCGTPPVSSNLNFDVLPFPLRDRGGPTHSLALKPGSDGIDEGIDSICAAASGSPGYGANGVDQRGLLRPRDGDGNGSAQCDSGVVENDPGFNPNNILVIDPDKGTNLNGALFRVNPWSGVRTLSMDFGVGSPLGSGPLDGVLDVTGALVVADPSAGTNSQGAPFRIDNVSGARMLLSDFGVGDNPGENPRDVALEASGDFVVIDSDAGTNSQGALFRLNHLTGARTVLSDFGVGVHQGVFPESVAVAATGQILVSDSGAGTNGKGAVFRVHPISGVRTLLSDFGVGANPGSNPRGLAVEASGQLLVVDRDAGTQGRGVLFRVAPGTGARTLLSDFGVAPHRGVDPEDVAVAASGLMLVVDAAGPTGLGALYQIHPVSLARSLLTDFGSGTPQAGNPSGLVVEPQTRCGDGVTEAGEQCDDGNIDNGGRNSPCGMRQRHGGRERGM